RAALTPYSTKFLPHLPQGCMPTPSTATSCPAMISHDHERGAVCNRDEREGAGPTAGALTGSRPRFALASSPLLTGRKRRRELGVVLVLLPAVAAARRVPRQINREHRVQVGVGIATTPVHLVVADHVVVGILVDGATGATRRQVVADAEVRDRDAERIVLLHPVV